ncbi:MAG: ATP-binding protein [Eubacteriales bacterium]
MTLFGKKCGRSAKCGFPASENEIDYFAILSFGERYRPSGNLWQSYLTYLLISDENPYSLACERAATVNAGSLTPFALSDMAEIRTLFHNIPAGLSGDFVPVGAPTAKEDGADAHVDIHMGRQISALAKALRDADSDRAFLSVLTDFYQKNGVGVFGLCGAFYLDPEGVITPVSHFSPVTLDDLWGYEDQKAKMTANLDAFTQGRPANNMLLYGDAGTGKSTCIKALANRYRNLGLRLIQIRKDQYVRIEGLISALRRRNYRFALYLDDLSFEDFEVEYKYLKAAIEGGLESSPENFLIFATSNRRHLIKETFDEREGGGDIHRNESVQEKISLSDRFGLQIRFGAPVQQDYFDIVRFLANERGVDLPDDVLIDGARKFAMLHSGYSGRVAEQYIRMIEGEKKSDRAF